MKRIPYSDPCVNGSSVHPRSPRGCAEPSIEQRVNLSLNAANQRLAVLRQQQRVGSSVSSTASPQAAQSRERLSDHAEKRVNSHTVDNWCSPLRQIGEQPHKPEPRKTAPIAQTLALSPQLLAAMLRDNVTTIGRVWLLARALDEDKQGWLPIERLREALTSKGSVWRICGWRRLRQLLSAGSGQFWERDDRGRLWLFGTARVAANLGVERITRTIVELPLDSLLGTIGEVKAAFFATQHTGDAPISRAALTEITAVPERTQRHYDALSNTEKQTNWGIGAQLTESNQRDHFYRHGGAAFIFKDKLGQRRLARQLPNSYRCPFRVTTKANKRLNQALQDLVKQGRRGNVQAERRYFADGRSMLDSKATSGYVRDQHMRGLALWIFVAR